MKKSDAHKDNAAQIITGTPAIGLRPANQVMTLARDGIISSQPSELYASFIAPAKGRKLAI